MSTFIAHDGTRLCYEVFGEGLSLVCLAGGPMQDAAYLGDLGGLSTSVQLIRLDLRGTGRSATPEDLSSCRCDRLVDDVEALREHLGLEQLDLLGHSAGANLAVSYVVRHPDRVRSLVLVTPSVFAVGIDVTAEDRRGVIERRKSEPEFGQVSAAFERIAAQDAGPDDWDAIVPFTYGRWDAAAREHHARGADHRHPDAAAAYGADGAFDPGTIRTGLAALDAPVVVVAGELDLAAPPSVMAAVAALFPNSTLVTQPGAGHMPWLDDPETFKRTVTAFLS